MANGGMEATGKRIKREGKQVDADEQSGGRGGED